ncbi:acylphosphatase [Methanolobus chelungpuianus]|uniref:acylphosphatase n=1 Tax=Methanolobus chelungpuianus TaxID=502115 RepID=A0AAE3KYR6_9EURY|nr:acylphosphatase [Methanolobus chelungpuianus]
MIVSGKVQGVYYRKFTQENAIRLGLAGFARNMPDGRVEVVAEGPRGSIETLIEMLHRGPAFSRVKDVDVRWSSPSGEFSAFGIKR